MPQLRLASVLWQKQNKEVADKLVKTTGLMATLPLVAFFVVRWVAQQQGSRYVDAWSGGAAVMVTNFVVAGYVVMAFSEKDPDEELRRQQPPPPAVGFFKTD